MEVFTLKCLLSRMSSNRLYRSRPIQYGILESFAEISNDAHLTIPDHKDLITYTVVR